MKEFFLAVWLLMFCSMSSFAVGSDNDNDGDEKSDKKPSSVHKRNLLLKQIKEEKVSSGKKNSSSPTLAQSGTPSTPTKGNAQSSSDVITTPLSSNLQSLALDPDSNQSTSSSASQSALPRSQRQARASTSSSEAAYAHTSNPSPQNKYSSSTIKNGRG